MNRTSDLLAEMTIDQQRDLADAIFRVQCSTADRADLDHVKAVLVRRRLRGELDQDDIDRALGTLVELWRTSPHFDGRF